MYDERILSAAKEYISELFSGDCGGHDADHSLRVFRNSMLLADTEPGCNRLIVALAALLHDADDRKLFHTEHNQNARAFLAAQGLDTALTEQICEAINSVSFSQNRGRRPETIEGKIVQDADRLDALGAVGIARTFAYGGSHARPLEDSVRHFYEKLLLLKDEMNTDEGRKIALKRHRFTEAFLRELNDEM